MPKSIVKIDVDHPLWMQLMAHLRRVDHLRHLTDEQGISPRYCFFGAAVAEQVVGHISLHKQALLVPSEPPTNLMFGGSQLHESFVDTFLVEEAYRRQGIGTALQLAALRLTRELGCQQMRSWSSLDKPANYAMKLQLGFVFCPGVTVVQTTGQRIPGGWFIKQA